MDIRAWLERLDLGEYAEAFSRNHVTPDLLISLTDGDLKDIGVASLGHRRRLIAAIGALRNQSAAPAPPPAKEQRHVAILFADLTDFTGLAQRVDAERLHDLAARYAAASEAEVIRFGGTVDKHVGDAVMALFGVSVGHGDDALRAIRCALGIHAAMEPLAREFGLPLSAHIGIAIGDVVAGAVGGNGKSGYTVPGDAVNLAAKPRPRRSTRSLICVRAGADMWWCCAASPELARAAFWSTPPSAPGRADFPSSRDKPSISATTHVRRAQEITQALGAARFEPENLSFLGHMHAQTNRLDEARRYAADALSRCRETGMAFIGPSVLGLCASVTTDPAEKGTLIGEAEAILAAGSPGHNHFWFHRAAIEVGLDDRRHDIVTWSADELDAFTAAEPIPWATFVVARGRALADAEHGVTDETRARIEMLIAEARSARLDWAVPRLEPFTAR